MWWWEQAATAAVIVMSGTRTCSSLCPRHSLRSDYWISESVWIRLGVLVREFSFLNLECKQCYWSFLLDFIRISWWNHGTIVWWNETQHWITLFFKHWGKHVCIRCCWMPLNVEMFEWMSLLLSFNLWICFVLLWCCLRILLKCAPSLFLKPEWLPVPVLVSKMF